jgi:hypothetical protein
VQKEEQRESTQVRVRRAKPKASPCQEISYQNQNFLLSRKQTRWKGSKIFPLQGEFSDLTDALGEPGCYRDKKKCHLFLDFLYSKTKTRFANTKLNISQFDIATFRPLVLAFAQYIAGRVLKKKI